MKKKRTVVSKIVNLTMVPEHLQKTAIEIIYPFCMEQKIEKSTLIRKCFLNENFDQFKFLPNNILANFFCCSQALISQILSNFYNENQEILKSKLVQNKGRPKYLNDESELKIIQWINEHCQKQNWTTYSSFKNKVLEELENINLSYTPNSHFYYDLQQKLFKDKYTIKLASPLESQRYQINNDIII